MDLKGDRDIIPTRERLLDYFMVVGFDLESQLTPKWVDEDYNDADDSVLATHFSAMVINRYPLEDYLDCPLPLGMDSFCFPKGLKFSPRDDHARVHYFVTTGGYGEDVYRMYACALTLMEGVPEPLLPWIYRSLVAARRSRLANPQQVEAGEEEEDDSQLGQFLVSAEHFHPACLWGPWSISSSGTSSDSIASYFSPFNAGSVHPACLLSKSDPQAFPPLFAPKSLVLLSHEPFLQNFRTFLTELYRVSLGQSQFRLERIISNFLIEVPLPPLGRTMVQYTFPSSKKTLFFARPPENDPFQGSPINIRILFEFLDADNVTFLLEQLLAQTKVVVLSRHLSAVVLVCESLLTMLFPFEFTTNYVPLLPLSMIETLDAPGGGLFGTHEDFLTHDITWGLEGCVVVELDNNQLSQAFQGGVYKLVDLDAARDRLCPFTLPTQTRHAISHALQPLANKYRTQRPPRLTQKDLRRNSNNGNGSTGSSHGNIFSTQSHVQRASSFLQNHGSALRSSASTPFIPSNSSNNSNNSSASNSVNSIPQNKETTDGYPEAAITVATERGSKGGLRPSLLAKIVVDVASPPMPFTSPITSPFPSFLSSPAEDRVSSTGSGRLEDLKRRNDLDLAIEFVPLPDQILDEEEQERHDNEVARLERHARHKTFKELAALFKGYQDFITPFGEEIFDTKAFLLTRKSSQRRWVGSFLLTPMWEQFLRLVQLGAGPAAHPIVRYLNETFRPSSAFLTDTSRAIGNKPYVSQPLQVPLGTPNVPYGRFPRLVPELFGHPSIAPDLAGQPPFNLHKLPRGQSQLLSSGVRSVAHDSFVFVIYMDLLTQLVKERLHVCANQSTITTEHQKLADRYSHLGLTQGLEVLDIVQAQGLKPHTRLFSILMAACENTKDTVTALRLYQQMKELNLPVEPSETIKMHFANSWAYPKVGWETIEQIDRDHLLSSPKKQEVGKKQSKWMGKLGKWMGKSSLGSPAHDRSDALAHSVGKPSPTRRNSSGDLAKQVERSTASQLRGTSSSRQRARRFEDVLGGLLTIKTSQQCPNAHCKCALTDEDIRDGWTSRGISSSETSCYLCFTRFRAKLQVQRLDGSEDHKDAGKQAAAELSKCHQSSEFTYFPPRYLDLQLHIALKSTPSMMEICAASWRIQQQELFVNLVWHFVSQGLPISIFLDVRPKDFLERLETESNLSLSRLGRREHSSRALVSSDSPLHLRAILSSSREAGQSASSTQSEPSATELYAKFVAAQISSSSSHASSQSRSLDVSSPFPVVDPDERELQLNTVTPVVETPMSLLPGTPPQDPQEASFRLDQDDREGRLDSSQRWEVPDAADDDSDSSLVDFVSLSSSRSNLVVSDGPGGLENRTRISPKVVDFDFGPGHRDSPHRRQEITR
eukprot:gb/GEZN01000509.1/.p1 GENE.gb/GEZN01000509.1/~~gb/GEZN01000509.1/.p1  ORF type:complete len:1389 (-),score=185.54 gb/GEZN01000509.1/:16-4182(-)